MEAKPFLVAVILGAAMALFVFRHKAESWFPHDENFPIDIGRWKTQATIAILAVIGLAYMLSD